MALQTTMDSDYKTLVQNKTCEILIRNRKHRFIKSTGYLDILNEQESGKGKRAQPLSLFINICVKIEFGKSCTLDYLCGPFSAKGIN